MNVSGLLGGDDATFRDPPQQIGRACLVGEEELCLRINLRQQRLSLSPGVVFGLGCGELRVTDEFRQQFPECFPVVRGGVPSRPGAVEASAKMSDGWGLAIGSDDERVEGRPHRGQILVAGAGEQGDVWGRATGEVGEVTEAESFGEPEQYGQTWFFESPGLQGFDPAGRSTDQATEDLTGHVTAST